MAGYQLPTLRASTFPVAPGDTLIMFSDGVRDDFAIDAALVGDPQATAEKLLADHMKGTDDSLVLVVKYVGRAQ